jgi:hypothetical protein
MATLVEFGEQVMSLTSGPGSVGILVDAFWLRRSYEVGTAGAAFSSKELSAMLLEAFVTT